MIDEVIRVIQELLGSKPAILHEPYFGGNESAYVAECVETGWVSSVGSFVDRFEAELAAYTGSAHAIACSNGTSALFIALKIAGVKQDDEVIVPAMTFVATANAVSHAGATPHFVDVDDQTLGMDPQKLSDHLQSIAVSRNGHAINRHTGRPITAVVPMHCFGHPCDVESIISIADRYGLPVIEDAAESLGSTSGDRHTGTFGKLGMISFNGNKILTTGGGGAILTDDEQCAEEAKHLTTTAKVSKRFRFFHDQVGYNFRLPNLNAALGCGQLEQLPDFIDVKRNLAAAYHCAFQNVDTVDFVCEPVGCRSNYWFNTIRLRKDIDLTEFLNKTNDAGIMTRPTWDLLCSLPMYRNCPTAEITTARHLVETLVNLPSGVEIAKRVDDRGRQRSGDLPNPRQTR